MLNADFYILDYVWEEKNAKRREGGKEEAVTKALYDCRFLLLF